MNEPSHRQILIRQGWIQHEDGTLSYPAGRILGDQAPVLQRPGAAAQDDPAPGQQARRRSVGIRSKSGPVGRVLFVTCANPRRGQKLDDDNWELGIRAGLKPLRDAIARSLGVDDHQSTVTWEYRVIEAQGEEGVFVRVEAI